MKSAAYLVCYDVSDDRERERVARVVEAFGLRLQYSVFECRLSRSRLAALCQELELLKIATGGIIICRLDDRARRHQVGANASAEPLAGAVSHCFVV